MSKIFGRSKEIKILERLLNSTRPEFLAIYGRRRVGKTYLINEFFKDKGIFFSATGSYNSNKKVQLNNFYHKLMIHFPNLKVEKEFKDWGDALHALKDAIISVDPSKKVIIFFDELPWLSSNRSGFLQALEYIWNAYLSQLNNVLLIVCGSAANWIIKKVINSRGGLYGRLSEVIKLNAFTLDETEKFLLAQQVKLSRKQIVELYMCLGGIAKYLTFVDQGQSVAQTINQLCFTPQGQLVHEFNNLYHSLFENAHQHLRIVKELAEKKTGIYQKELLENLQISSGGNFSDLLEDLEECGFITRSLEFNKKAKDKKVWLIDEYSYFYLAWMEKIKGSINLGNDIDYWLKMHHDPHWKIWSGYAFESLCMKHVAQIKKKLGISSVLTHESEWSYRPKDKSEKGAQIDLIIDRKDDCINLCEIKFCVGEFVIDQTYAKELERKINVFREQTKTPKTLFLTLITPYGVRKNQYSIELVNQEITMEDFFD